ncbi:MAG: hypothetical protein LBN05_08110, partial [Oscillospiraceae bacterium]|nr:hypothetical protein [Oscillospiraceae bacterium]
MKSPTRDSSLLGIFIINEQLIMSNEQLSPSKNLRKAEEIWYNEREIRRRRGRKMQYSFFD